MQIDAKKLKYDLALAYAKSKFDNMLRSYELDPDECPQNVAETDYLLDKFKEAYKNYDLQTDESLIDMS